MGIYGNSTWQTCHAQLQWSDSANGSCLHDDRIQNACLCLEVRAETEDQAMAWELLQEGAGAAPRKSRRLLKSCLRQLK
jgi:hypothetical protein